MIRRPVHNKAKQWAKTATGGSERRWAIRARILIMKGEWFTINGPHGEILKTWTVDKNGEHETADN
jgi:hypothetical protein